MSSLRILGVLALALCSLASTACSESGLEEAEEEAVDAYEEAISSTNRLSMNRLKASSLHIKDLSTDPLSSNGTTLAPNGLLQSKDGRDALTYILRCALPVGKTLTAQVGAKVYIYSGLIGIAPEWLTQPLTQTGRRWMTACLLAHVNAYGQEVLISLRGNKSALAVTADEAADFTLQEMSFYGDIFKESGEPEMYACAGYGLQDACPSILDNYQPRRACKAGTTCAITVPGPCYDISALQTDSCESASASSYNKCHATVTLRGFPWPANAPVFNEVVTVYLREVDFQKYYAECFL